VCCPRRCKKQQSHNGSESNKAEQWFCVEIVHDFNFRFADSLDRKRLGADFCAERILIRGVFDKTSCASGAPPSLIALVSDKPGTLELHELSLAIKAPNGMVLVVGCSHPGIDKIVEAASTIDPRILLIVGGFHLVVASDADIQKIVTTLHDTLNVQYVAPGHCTGEPAFTALKKAFGDRYLFAGLGTTFALSTSPN
jgi:metal-dependent hydrolase (beta-lactamase superfamily II)